MKHISNARWYVTLCSSWGQVECAESEMLRDAKSPAQQRKSLNPDPAARCCPARLWHRAFVNRMKKLKESVGINGSLEWCNGQTAAPNRCRRRNRQLPASAGCRSRTQHRHCGLLVREQVFPVKTCRNRHIPTRRSEAIAGSHPRSTGEGHLLQIEHLKDRFKAGPC